MLSVCLLLFYCRYVYNSLICSVETFSAPERCADSPTFPGPSVTNVWEPVWHPASASKASCWRLGLLVLRPLPGTRGVPPSCLCPSAGGPGGGRSGFCIPWAPAPGPSCHLPDTGGRDPAEPPPSRCDVP